MATDPGAQKIDGHMLFPIFSTEKPPLVRKETLDGALIAAWPS